MDIRYLILPRIGMRGSLKIERCAKGTMLISSEREALYAVFLCNYFSESGDKALRLGIHLILLFWQSPMARGSSDSLIFYFVYQAWDWQGSNTEWNEYILTKDKT